MWFYYKDCGENSINEGGGVNMYSLDEKIEKTFSYFRFIVDKVSDLDRVFVSWSGGKDSTALLWLWKKFLRQNHIKHKISAITIDTGFIFPEIKEFIEEFKKNKNIDLYTIKPDVDLSKYPKDNVVLCCSELKIRPLKKAVKDLDIKFLLSGIRWDESEKRKGTLWLKERNDPYYIQINPIIHWTEMDVWTYHMKEDIPHCSLYDVGYRSIDCMPCTKIAKDSERSGRNSDKEDRLDILSSLGYF